MTLDERIARRLGCERLTRAALEAWQLRALRETVRHVEARSPFGARLAGMNSDAVKSTEDLPFTDVKSLTEAPLAFLCVPQGDIARVATFRTSGTLGPAKRIFFTEEDLESTVDFFANGMEQIPGTRTLICMSGDSPGSVGTLLAEALRRIGRTGIVGGFVEDPEKTLDRMRTSKIDSLVGVPGQMLALARCRSALFRGSESFSLKGILLSGDYASDDLVRAVSEAFDCPVFRHFGMAETGYGAAVECERHRGLHIREADLLFEIVDETGKKLPDGEWGEAVVTTLTRRGMPLIRYKTGDLGRLLSGLCECGSVLKRIEVRGRLGNVLNLPTGDVHLSALDDALDPLPWLSEFEVATEGPEAKLGLSLRPAGPLPDDWREQTKRALETIVPFRDALSDHGFHMKIELSEGFAAAPKRMISRMHE